MKKIIIRLIVVVISLGVLGGIAGTSVLIYFSFDLPKISSLNDYHPPIPSRILSKDGTVLAEVGKENRAVAKFDEIPRRVVDAFLSAEDDSFYEHTGVDYMGVFRALIANLKAGRVVQGGSTITQQVAKSLLLSRERSISRKVKDFLLAQKIEEKFSKEEILFLYLNQVYLGGGYYGVKSAFEGYFDKPLEEATIAEASQVAGLLVAPGKYSPYVNPKRARIRQQYVLKRMFETGKITKEEYEEAVNERIKFRIRKPEGFKAGYFTDWVRQRVIALIGNEEFLREGFTVQTTIDYGLQKVAEEKVLETVKEVDKRQGFKGPLGKIKLEELDDWRAKFLTDFYKTQSSFFTLNNKDEKVYELEFDPEENLIISKNRSEFREVVKKKRFFPGFSKDSAFSKFIKEGDIYKGIVLYVDDWARAVYVDVGGVVGVISYDGFRWAHERKISEDRNFYPYVTKPSTILNPGDIVQVQVLSLNYRLTKLVTDQFEKYIAKQPKDAKRLLYNQKYMKLMLDQEPEAQGALVSMNPDSGEVVSLVGGYDFSKSQFNRAIQSKRQPGSAFKPILFAAALENGYTPATIIIDSPETLGGVDESLNWKPRNYDGKFKGPTTLRNSLEQSRNVPTVKIAADLGVQTILDFVDRIGLKAKLDEDLSLSLGSFGVTLMDIVSTYAVFPNGGRRIVPKSIVSITDRYGSAVPFDEKYEDLKPVVEEETVLAQSSPIPEIKEEGEPGEGENVIEEKQNPFLLTLGGDQVYDSRLAYIMTNLLRGIVQYGTGRGARHISSFIGGKTGTTNNYVDAWFLGFSQNLVTGVWTGFDENQTLGWGETGAKAALPTWRDFMAAGIKKYGESDFRPPLGIVNVLIDKETGRTVRPGSEGGFLESFVEGTEPGAEKEPDEKGQENISNGPILEEDDYYTNQ
ncbi:MAG: PBP1A family penicillin-binding protein [Halobacteriovoraceae bacterium]|nr:PBP1A family penicillin-binding protein [Halobacteriovoraceae bacterium]